MTVKACYNCLHYERTEERKGKKTLSGEFCLLFGQQLKIATVVADEGPIGLIAAGEYVDLQKKKRVYSFGSPAEYFEKDGSKKRCPNYERK